MGRKPDAVKSAEARSFAQSHLPIWKARSALVEVIRPPAARGIIEIEDVVAQQVVALPRTEEEQFSYQSFHGMGQTAQKLLF
jgi:hypothetical protein